MIGRGLYELRRRRVFRAAGLYLLAAWAILALLRGPALSAAPATVTLAGWLFLALFPVTVLFSWLFRWTHEGIAFEHAEDGRPPRTWFGRTLDIVAIGGGLAGAVGLALLLSQGLGPDAPAPTEMRGLFARP